MKYPEANLLVVRNVFNTHYYSTYAQLRWAIERLGVSDSWRATVSPLELRYLPTGQRILFRGFDDVHKLASTTVDNGYLCWVWIEEAFEISSQADFDKLDLSVPRGEIPPPLFKQTTLTFNPWNQAHWLKSRFFDRPAPDVLAMTVNYKCNEFLDRTDKTARGTPPAVRRGWTRGMGGVRGAYIRAVGVRRIRPHKAHLARQPRELEIPQCLRTGLRLHQRPDGLHSHGGQPG
jgi:hypothetical protein